MPLEVGQEARLSAILHGEDSKHVCAVTARGQGALSSRLRGKLREWCLCWKIRQVSQINEFSFLLKNKIEKGRQIKPKSREERRRNNKNTRKKSMK